MESSLKIDKNKISNFCQRHFIKKLSLFGSVVKGGFTDHSDIDVLVEFEPGHIPSFFKLFDMENELSEIFSGRKVEMKTPEDLSRYFRDDLLGYAEVQYAA